MLSFENSHRKEDVLYLRLPKPRKNFLSSYINLGVIEIKRNSEHSTIHQPGTKSKHKRTTITCHGDKTKMCNWLANFSRRKIILLFLKVTRKECSIVLLNLVNQ